MSIVMLDGCNRGRPNEAENLVGRGTGPTMQRRAPNAERARQVGPREFEYVRYSIDVSQAQPRACLTFSNTLDPAKDYTPYVSVTPQTQFALQVDGANLCVGGLTFGVERAITVRAGLPAQDGRTLAYEETFDVEFGDRPSYVGFKGDGVILPRIEADGLGLETVNVSKVRVTVSRVTDRALVFRSITQGYAASQGNYENRYLDYESNPEQYTQPIWTGTIDTPGSPNAATTTVFPIAEAVGRLQPGAYFIGLEQLGQDGKVPEAGAEAKRWLIITDLALTTYTGSNGMSATVRSLQTARPQRGVKLELVARNNEILARGETDANGHLNFNGAVMKGEGNMAPRMVMAYGVNGDFAVLDLDRSPVDLTERDIGGREPANQADAMVYTERGVYRPGETVLANALLRDPAANAITNRAGSLIVYSPNGIEAGRQRFTSAPNAGGIRYDFALPRAAARGQWRMVANVDGVGEVGATSFSVEDFVPQRVELKLTADTTSPMRGGERRPVTADVRFLYGAPGAGLPVEAAIRAEVDPNPFPQLREFSIGRHNEEFREIAFDTPATAADGAGRATIILDPSSQRPESSKPLRLHVVVSAIEPGGRAVRDDLRVAYRPADRYLGIRGKFEDSAREDEQAEFEVVALDRAGALKAGNINWRLVRIDWKYDWYRASEGGAWQWRQSRNVVEVEEGNARFADGARGTIKTSHRLAYGDYELLLTDTGTGAEASMGFWTGWGGAPQDGVEAPDRVRLVVPDTLPAVGSEVEIGVMAPYDGEAEIVVAADNVITTRSIRVSANGGTRVKLPVTAEWGAGVYVMASVYTPRDPTSRPRPRRAVGVAHVSVDVAPRTFNLTLTAPQVQRPRSRLDLQIAATGPVREDTWVTVAAVDEGILLLTGFKSPSATDYFFGKRRLGVDLRDDYGRLLDPNQGAASPVRSGGDQIGGAGLSVVPTKSVAIFSGPVKLDRNGRATVSLDIPDFNGSLRIMAVAWSRTGLGQASQNLVVRDAVPAEVILPRFLAPGDEAVATLTMDNIEGAAGPYRAALGARPPVATTQASVQAQLAQRSRQELPVTFSASAEGISEISLNVTGPNNFAVGRTYPIQSRSPWLPASSVVRRVLQPGESFTPEAGALASYIPGSSQMTVSFSPIPMDAAALYDSLDKYPYGCTEQIVSRAMPLLYAHQMAALAGRRAPGDMRNTIQEAVSTLLNRQSADGAIGLWRIGDGLSTPWLGAYATDFLFRAKQAGFVVPDAALDKAFDALEAFAIREQTYGADYNFDVYESKWNPDTRQLLMDRSTAYASYVLAKAARMDRARLRYLHDERLARMPGPLAKAQLGAALYMIGDNARSRSAFTAAEGAIGYENQGDYYQTPRRDLAGMLALAGEARRADLVRTLSEQVGRDLPEPDRLTTQEKAFLLLAANALSGGTGDYTVGLRGQATAQSNGKSYLVSEAQARTPPTFTNTSRSPLWMTAVSRGSPASAPPSAAEGLDIDKQLYSTDGSPINGSSFTQGQRVIIAIRAASRSARITPLVIADLLPAGFEIEAILQPHEAGNTGAYRFLGEIASPNIAEARDDRFVASLDLYDQRPAKVAYIIRAVTPGSFTMPGAVAEDMYRPDVFGRTSSQRITVARRQ
jgi:uncharacterized protein YfaS (alpha-2-macroglobulin family)